MVATHKSQELRLSFTDRVDAVLFAFAGLSTLWLGYLLVREGARPGWQMLLLVLFWILLTYLLLPRLHRILTRIYVPGYFIGRARTSDGLLGDPVNLALLGHEDQVHEVMTRAGWTRADDLSAASAMGMIRSTLTRRSYPEAPVSPLLLFDRQQDFAYQQEVDNNPAKRHHVRFWRAPEGWMLPGGFTVDWLAAGTYDRSVGLSLFTLQITHKIEANTDIERDYIVETVTAGTPEVEIEVIRDFSTGYHSRNGGGDLIQTDGDLPIIDVRRVKAPPLPVRRAHRQPRPSARCRSPSEAWCRSLRGSLFLLGGAVLMLLPLDVLTQIECHGRPHSRHRRRHRAGHHRGPGHRRRARGVLRPQLGADPGHVDQRVRGAHGVHQQRRSIRGDHPRDAANGEHQHPGAAGPLQPSGPGLRPEPSPSAEAAGGSAARSTDGLTPESRNALRQR